MKLQQLLPGLLIAGSVVMTVAQPVRAEVVQVTGVQLNSTPDGLQVILQTTNGAAPQVVTSSYDQTLLIDLLNAQLSLPEGDTFTQDNPAFGITSVTVNRLYGNSVRVTIKGVAELPIAEVVPSPQGVVLSLTTASETAEAPPSQETPETTDSEPSESPQTPSEGEAADETQPDTDAPVEEPEEIELVVTGQQEGGYRVTEATTATRTDTPLRDVPQSIQVVPQQVIEDQQVVRITEAARNVSGVVRSEGYGGATDNYTIRGFAISSNLRNGFSDGGFYSLTDVATIERVEVLKGPASVLYGQIEPGGVVNYITKQPLSEPYYAASFTAGSYDFYRPSIDISGPLDPDKTVLYRLNVAYENSGSFRDFVDSELFVVAPVLSFKITDKTTLTLEYEYLDLDRTFDRAFPPLTAMFDLPISRYLGEPNDSYNHRSHKASYVLDHRFSENWRLRNAFSAQIVDTERKNVQARTFQLEGDGRTLRRRYNDSDENREDYSLQTDLVGKFNTGSINHQLLIGLELSKIRNGYTLRRANFPSIDIYNPVYGFPRPTSFGDAFGREENTNTLGIYVQDQMTLLPNLKLLIGGRFDSVDLDIEDVADALNGSEAEKTSRYFEAFSPRVGIVYQPIEPISLYASYSRSFRPNIFAFTSNGQLIEPEKGTQYEAGIKGEFLDGRLSTTLAAYQITKTNVATTDPNDTDFSIAAGEVKSRGIELDVRGEIAPGWNVIASYAHMDAFVSKDETIPEGDELVNAPNNTASLWMTYEFQRGALQGLGFGAGLYFVGAREAELPNTIEIPSYLRTDAAIFYRRNNYRAALNIKNLFDIKYYDSQGFLVYPGAPLTLLGTFGVEF